MVFNTASITCSSSAYKTTSIDFQYTYSAIVPITNYAENELTDAEMDKIRKTMSKHEESISLLGL